MKPLFYNLLLRLTICGGVTVLFLLLLRLAAGKCFSPRWKRFTSAAVLLFFLIPFELPFRLQPGTAPLDILTQTAWPAPITEESAVPESPGQTPADWRGMMLLAWVGGALLSAAYHTVNWTRFSRSIRAGGQPPERQTEQLYRQISASMGLRRPPSLLCCAGVGAPMLMGVFRPRLLLPEDAGDERQLELILRHELTHYKSGDTLLKLAALAVATLHWFNPLAYLPGRLLENDCELACDQRLALAMDAEQRKRYGMAILDLMSQNGTRLSSGFSRRGNTVKRRLEFMLHAKAPSRRAKVVCAATGALLALVGALSSSALADTFPTGQKMAILGGGDGPTSIRLSDDPMTAPSLAQPQSAPEEPDLEALSDKLLNSIIVEADSFSFVIPSEPLPKGCNWFIHISGRTPDGVSMHWLESESDHFLWEPGKAYRADFDPETALGKGPWPYEAALFCEFQATILLPDGSDGPSFTILPLEWWMKDRGVEFKTPDPGTIPFRLSSPVPGAPKGAGFMNYYGHTGTDYLAGQGTDILAAADGTVVQAKYDDAGYGYHIIIDHGSGIQTLYGHCGSLSVKAGDTVKRGQVIAAVGRTGNTTRPQCHFEARQNGTPIDSVPFMEENP